MACSSASDRVEIKWSKRMVIWQCKERSIAQMEYVAHPDSSANRFLNDLIAAVDQRSYNG